MLHMQCKRICLDAKQVRQLRKSPTVDNFCTFKTDSYHYQMVIDFYGLMGSFSFFFFSSRRISQLTFIFPETIWIESFKSVVFVYFDMKC